MIIENFYISNNFDIIGWCFFFRSIVNQFKKPSAQQLEKSIKLLYSKDSSSSSSSDSDSDKEDKKIKKQEDKKFSKDSRKPSDLSNTNKRLDAVLQQFTQVKN